MKILIYLLIISLSFFMMACPDDDPNKPIIDPCEGKSPVTADFHIYDTSPWLYIGVDPLIDRWDFYIDTDTLIFTSDVTFSAFEENAEYEWHLGTEIIKDKSFTRTNFPPDQNIYVKLIVRKEPNTLCFPDDDGIDTLERVFRTVSFDDESGLLDYDPVIGTYLGSNQDEPNNVFNIYIFVKPKDPNDPIKGSQSIVNGLLNYYNNKEWREGLAFYKKWYLSNLGEGYVDSNVRPELFLKVYGANNDSIRIDYSYAKSPNWEDRFDRIEKTFIGWRI